MGRTVNNQVKSGSRDPMECRRRGLEEKLTPSWPCTLPPPQQHQRRRKEQQHYSHQSHLDPDSSPSRALSIPIRPTNKGCGALGVSLKHTHRLLLTLASVLVILTLPPGSHAQSDALKCETNLAHTLANCSGLGLHDVPWGLHNSLMTLDLSGNTFPRLRNQSFLGYKYLQYLYLRNNSLQALEAGAFRDVDYLKTLDLTNNKLLAVPEVALAPVASSLEQLLLAGNKIYMIPAGAFKGLSKLRHLDLSGNSIYQVQYGAFRGLLSLLVLKLRHNALKTLPSDAFDDFPVGMVQVQLYDNRWFCDCGLRWLRSWMNRTDAAVWNSTGYHVRCDGPSIVRDASLDSRPLDELACEVKMKTSGETRELAGGGGTTLLCKYTSVPQADAKWLRNSEIIDVLVTHADTAGPPSAITASAAPTSTAPGKRNKKKKKSGKFSVRTWTTRGYQGELTQVSELHIRDFRYDDIARYECFVQNIRGAASTAYRLTLEGVLFESVTSSQPSEQVASSSGGGVDTRSIVIAVAVVCGIVLIVAVGVLIFCSVNRVQRRRKEKRQAIEETVKQHFIENSEVADNGDAVPDKVDGITHDDDRSFSNNTNDSAATAVKRPFDLGGGGSGDDAEPPYIFQQPGSPFNNGNTYVSFGSELTDPGELTMLPMGTLGRGGPQQNQARHPSSSRGGYESSHAGSGTPLLDRGTPSVFDSDEPIEDYAQYPVYDSLTNTLQRPNGETSSVYGGSLHHPLHRGDGIYGSSLPHGEGIYGGSLQHYPLHAGAEPVYGGSMRNGGVYGRGPPGGRGEPAKRLSSFHYPPAATSSPTPRPPTNARPSSTLPAPVPRYADYPNGGSTGSHSPRLDYYRTGPPPVSPSPHNRTLPHHPDYRDYREMRYPTNNMGGGQKSMSVGNLGHYQPIPVASAPRKPPRVFQSREYLELTPSDVRPGAPNGDYITSPEAQKYSTNYGITPGTPV